MEFLKKEFCNLPLSNMNESGDEFVEHLCKIFGQNKGHDRSVLFSCLSVLTAVSAKMS
jgi:hypothetical protein